MKKELYKPMFRDIWELEWYKEEIDIWSMAEVKEYLDREEIEKAISFIREIYHGYEPSDADIQLRIAEKRPDLLKPSFEQFFRMNSWTYRDGYSGLPQAEYKGMRKLLYLYVDYARFCYRSNKEKLLKELQVAFYEVSCEQFFDKYVCLWYILEELLNIRSTEMQDYLNEKNKLAQEQRKTVWEAEENDLERMLLNETGLSALQIGFALENIDPDMYEAMGVTLIDMLSDGNIQEVEKTFNIICNTQNMYSSYKAQKQNESIEDDFEFDFSGITSEEPKEEEDDDWDFEFDFSEITSEEE